MKSGYRLSLLFSVCLLAVAPLLLAQTTGVISGRVLDQNGGALPGVTLEISGPSLQGTRTATSASDGAYRFPNIPSGTYTIVARLAGFSRVEKTGVRVEIGKEFTVNMTLGLSTKEEVLVSGEAPVVDTTSTTIGQIVNSEQFQRLPVQRDYANIAQTAPGVNTDAVGNTVYGSSGAENAYIIDGVNTTEVTTGVQGKSLNTEFIQEVEVKNGGYQAEYGRATGGLINVITKSGGNEFHGEAFGYYDNDSLQSTNKHIDEIKVRNSTGPALQTGFTRKDFGADLGGYFVKDRLWFFGAYDRVDNSDTLGVFRDISDQAPGAPAVGTNFDDKTKTDLYSGKLTIQATEGLSIVGTVFGDPGNETGPIRAIDGPPTTFLGSVDRGGLDAAGRVSWVLGSNWLIAGLISYHRDKALEAPGPGGNVAQIRDRTTPTLSFTGGLGYYERFSNRRYDYRLDVTRYLTNFGGDHEIKLGGEWELVRSDSNRQYSGGVRLDKRLRLGKVFYLHRFFTTGDATLDNPVILDTLPTNPETDNYAIYLQDSWKITKNFTASLGLRWERQIGYGAPPFKSELNVPFVVEGGTAGLLRTKNNWAPRIGLIWDPSGAGKTKLYASYGKFYETIPLDLNIRAFGGERIAFMNNYDPNPNSVQDGAVPGRASSIFGNAGEPVDSNLKGQYVEEVIVGAEKEIAPNFAVGVKGVYRSLKSVIEDFLCDIPTGNYCIGNPGQGIMKNVTFYNPDTGDLSPVPAPEAARRYRGIELNVTKRFSNNWSLIASYIYSTLKGNYDGTFQNSTGQLDPNINSAYDYANFLVNNNGYLSVDRRHQAKVSATYQTPFRLNVGLSAYYQSGTPLTTFGYYDNYSNYELYLTRRGEAIGLHRTPDTYEANLHLGYPLKLGLAEVNFIVDIFNILNTQKATQLDQRWGFNQDDNSNVVDSGTLAPITPQPKASDAPNTDYQKSIRWQAPREVRFGLRVSF